MGAATHRPIPPEQELALLLAGTAARRERRHERLLELVARVDADALEAFLRRTDMLALLGRRLERLAGERLPDDFRARLARHVTDAQRQGVGQQLLTVRLLAALEDGGVRALPLKGPLLAERLHGDAGMRLSADVDVLVARDRLHDAETVLDAFGYRVEPVRLPGDPAVPLLHERLVQRQGLPDVELHWRVHWYEASFSADLLVHGASSDGWLVPRPDDELALLLLLYARDGFAGLRLACDVAAWWDRYGARLGTDGLAHHAEAYPALARALATAALAAQRIVGLPAERVLPPALLAQASEHALRLANWPLRGAGAQVSANVSLTDWLIAPSGQRRALLRRHVLLSRRELRSRWPGASANAGTRMRLRLLHAARVGLRYGVAASTLLRGGSWAPLPHAEGPGGR